MKLARISTTLLVVSTILVSAAAGAGSGSEQDARRLYRQYDGIRLAEMEVALAACQDSLAEDVGDCLRWRDLAVARWKHGNLLGAASGSPEPGGEGFLAGAIEAFKTAILLCPDNLELQRGLARTYYDADDFESSLAVFSDLSSQWPDDARAHASIGNIQEKLGNYESAGEAYARALEIDPEVIPRSVLADVYHKLGDEVGEANQRQLQADATARDRAKTIKTRARMREMMVRLGTNQVVHDAFDLMRERRYEEAMHRFDQGIEAAKSMMDDPYFSDAALALMGQLEATKRMMLLEFEKRDQ